MPIERLEIEGYRSLQDVAIDLGDVTLVVGPNGSGKTNLYRAIRLLRSCAEGDVARHLVAQGGMDSVVFAGGRGEPKVRLAADLGGISYAIELVTVSRGLRRDVIAFPLDPVIRVERITVPEGRREVTLLDRTGSTAFVRDEDGSRQAFPAAFRESEAVLSQLVDRFSFPEIVHVRERLRRIRFHHGIRTDDGAAARQPSLGTRTPAVADDGSDLAAALRTILVEGERDTLLASVESAFSGAELDVVADDAGRLEIELSTSGSLRRSIRAPELSDGQLRYLHLAAALLATNPPEVLVLNEPESSLHVDLLPGLADLITVASARSQMIVVTHAAELVQMISKMTTPRSYRLSNTEGRTTVTQL